MQELAQRLTAQRAATVAWIVDGISDRALLRAGTTRAHAIDQLWLMDPVVYQRLTQHRRWSPAKYEKWFVDTVACLLMD